MATSFNVNQGDLEFILKQIKIAEATSLAYNDITTVKTTLEAIQAVFPDVSVTQAAILPFGLRTVDGSDNNLIPGQSDFGAADILFPRLTDPVFRNDQDGDQMPLGGPTVITNTNYDPTIPGSHSVADADPRIISNLIVDMTPGNPAAVEAALKYLVFTGAMDEATAAAAAPAIAAAHALTVQTRAAATPANVAALAATLATETTEQATAQANYNAAVLADAANAAAANAALASSNAAVTADDASEAAALLLLIGANLTAADVTALNTAVSAALDASNAAAAVVSALPPAHPELADATTVAANALSLHAQLLAIQSDPGFVAGLPAASFLAAIAAAATLADDNVAPAQSLTADLIALVDISGLVATTLTALITANAELAAADSAYNAAINPATVTAADAALVATLDLYGIEHDPLGSLVIPNTAPDAGLTAPFNSWMTFFGQFFDHGLDLVTKGNAGTVYVPLMADDPLIAGADGIFGNGDDLPAHLRFMALTRATVTVDANGVPQHENTTTSFVDQNQTYTSHSSHQVFLREYVMTVDGAVATGRFIDGSGLNGTLAGAPGNWAEVKAQALEMLGIRLNDFDVHNVPLLVTDQYGKFIPGPNGYAQMVMAAETFPGSGINVVVEGTAAGISTVGSLGTGHAFLNDIAHHAAPSIVDVDASGVRDGIKSTVQVADADIDVNGNGVYDAGIDVLTDVNGDGLTTTADFFAADKNLDGSLNELTYDNEMLDSHFVTGDGRGNENIALTAVHAVFHSEHNRIVDVNKATILASPDLTFINEWLRTPITLADIANQAQKDALIADAAAWDGERLFQAARFSTEMQYQHMVFEEFARRIQPDIDPFIFNTDSTIDASILAEFAHTVYRFGHSMLTGTVDRLDNDLATIDDPTTVGPDDQASLLAAFLNPQMYIASGATQSDVLANLVRGTTLDTGNQIDEFIVQDVRSNLLGLPLDLAVLNIARGRDTGIPSLNETRQQLHNAGVLILTPYTSWLDFESNINNKLSAVNFMAAYGTHAAITSAATAAEARDAALLLRLGDGTDADGVTIRGTTYTTADRLAFLNGTVNLTDVGGIDYSVAKGGVDLIDLWIGGLAEKRPEFGSAFLGQTFNYVFEFQMEQLQFGDRFYYLSRTQGMNFLNQLEPNTFADIVMRNSELGGVYATHLGAALFLTPDLILELDRGIAQADYNIGDPLSLDPDWETPPSLPVEKVTRDYSTIVNGVLPTTIVVDGVTHNVGGSIIFRGAEHTVIGGTEGNDYIRSDEGDDTVWGDGGDDHLLSGDGVDSVFGGDGDDVIEDIEGAGDFLRGERGNDVIYSARGAFDVLFGGEGKDYVQVGLDVMEVFAGEGDDFVLGGAGSDLLMGNEGNDWIEGGPGFDTLVGENSELFFNSPVVGHDVLFGHGDETDMDAESGDDIMASSPSVYRNEGMFGFDWGIAKFDPSQIDFDLKVPVFTTDQADVLRDRWDQVEALSGWNNDDQLRGDDRGAPVPVLAPVDIDGNGVLDDFVVPSLPDPLTTSELFVNNVLDQAGIDRIDGFSQFLAGAGGTLGLSPVGTTTTFREGNILMGGDGNDVIAGRAGYDVIDGDAWLNVRIKIDMGNGVVYSAESLSTDTALSGPNAGKVYATFANGDTDFTAVQFGGRSLQSLLLDRTINPGQMSIVREIKYDNTNLTGSGRNLDTAVFQGNMAEYDVEGSVDLNGDGDSNDEGEFAAIDVDGDGFISVRDRDNGDVGAVVDGVQLATRRPIDAAGGLFTDDLDLLRNIEQLQFADQTVQIVDIPTLVNWNGVRPASETALPGNGAVIANLSMASNAVVNPIWSVSGGNAPVTVTGGVVTTTAALLANSVYTLTVRATETGNASVFVEESITIRTGTAGVDSLNGDGLTDVIYALAGDDLVNGFGGNDTLFGQAGDDTLNGGSGSDNLTGGIGNDIVNGDTGNDTINYVIGDGADTVGGGGGSDRLVLTSGGGNETLAVTLDAAGVLTNFQGGSVTSVESVTANLGGGTDTLSYTAPGGVTVNLVSGTATGFTSIAGIENVNTNGGSDTLTGDGNDNVFNAGGAADTVNGGGGNDTMTGGGGDDTLNGDAGIDILAGGTGVDSVSGGIGDDTIRYVIGDGVDAVIDGGAGTDTVEILANGGAQTLDVTYDGAAITNFENNTAFTSIERFTANLGNGTDTLVYTSAAGVAVNLSAATASGFASLAGVENVTGGAGSDTLTGDTNANILSGGGGNDTLVATVDNVRDTMDGGTGTNTANYAAYAAGLTVNLGGAAPIIVGGSGSNAANSDVVVGIQNFTGGTGVDSITGSGADNVLRGGAGSDTLNGGGGVDQLFGDAGGDILIGGAGADAIDTGPADDNVIDRIRFSATGEFGDTIINFDANGGVAVEDRVEFGGALNTAYDDGDDNNDFLFVTGDGSLAGTIAATVGQTNEDAEALLLLNGVATANLSNLGLVSAAINNEFVITAANGEDALLVVDAGDGNSFGVYQWIQAGGGETAAAELTLVGVFNNGSGLVGTTNFDFF